MKFFVGVDGGQSGTRALIADETGRVVGAGATGPSNPSGCADGHARFQNAVSASVREAREHAGIGDVVFAAACFGLSGAPPEDWAREIVQSERYLITHDAAIALAGATTGGPGIIVIAGTGSIAFAKNADGKTARAGGWGYAFGDEGGGFDLARKALRAALQYEEGWGPATRLREMLLKTSGARDANDLLHRLYANGNLTQRAAALAPIVDQAANAGDAVAAGILHEAAQSLATLAGAVRRQLFPPGSAVDVRYSGGAFRAVSIQARFQMLVELEEGAQVSAPQFNPAEGALIEAFRVAGVQLTLKSTSSANT